MQIIAPARPQIIECSGRSVGGLGGRLVSRRSVWLVASPPTQRVHREYTGPSNEGSSNLQINVNLLPHNLSLCSSRSDAGNWVSGTIAVGIKN